MPHFGLRNAASRSSVKWLLKWQLPIALVSFALMLVVVVKTEAHSYRFVSYLREITRPVPKILENDDRVPTVDYGKRDGLHIGEQSSPVIVSLSLSRAAVDYMNGDLKRKADIQALADWLTDALDRRGDYGLYVYKFPWPDYDLAPPFVSALAQGFAARALAQADAAIGDERYREASELALRALFVSIEDGGMTIKTDSGWWYEEYAKEGVEESRILNGMMYVLISMYDYWELTGNEEAMTLFENGISELAATLPAYDNGRFSHYDIHGKSAGGYHGIHVELLDRLYKITGNPLYAKYRDRWDSHWGRPFAERLFLSPTKKGVAIALLNTAVIALVLDVPLFIYWLRRRSGIAPTEDARQRVHPV